jgi:hypothetical protein
MLAEIEREPGLTLARVVAERCRNAPLGRRTGDRQRA